MTVADLIEKWFQSNNMEKFWVHRIVNSDAIVYCTIRYNHTRLISTGNGSHFPEWLFYEVMNIYEYEVDYQDRNKVKRTLNVHDPQFFEKLEDELNDQIRRIEDRTTEAKLANRVLFGYGTAPDTTATL